MMFKWLGGLVDSNEKQVKQLYRLVDQVNELEPEFKKLSSNELRAKTDEFRARIAEATVGIKQRLVETQQKLEEAKKRLAGAQQELEREDANVQYQQLQQEIDRLDKETRETENRIIDEILPEAFAAVREAAQRTIVGQRHFDAQLMGGIVLHQGKIAEMKTGEGKTLVATLPLYLNSLSGRGCHLATVNDYLARRDLYWMGPIYHALGLRVASIYPQQTPDEYAPARLYDPEYDSGDKRWQHFRRISRQEAYQADITYGTSAESGFDYLRDNMVIDLAQYVQRPLNYAIVDEVDYLLIDEARTPLIISGQADESTQRSQLFARLVSRLQPETDYVVDEKSHTVNLTDAGIGAMENVLKREGLLKSSNLYDPANYSLVRYHDSALKANVLYRRDRDYVVKNGDVIIVDEFTGRLMYGRRYAEGLHQAIEAKERVRVQAETMTYATITIQNYFRMYHKLAGMTGTAATEAEEFYKIYKLEVVVIPTHKPMIRQDSPDQIYKSEEAKFRAVVKEVKQFYEQQRPVLIGTVSIEKSEHLGDLLKRQGIPHEILNAKYHEREAAIVARAGEPGVITVATNMAGRGVDIILGGSTDGQNEAEWQKQHDQVVASGGLHIIGTERHEARRIDNQLRGRAGRQGDPGSSRFYLSLEDDIMRRFGGDRIKGIMQWAGMGEDTPIENQLIDKVITDVQKRVEGYHFDTRKHLVEYDDVVNKHREVIYGERRKILSGANLKANILSMVEDEIQRIVTAHLPDEHGINWDIAGLLGEIGTIFPLPPDLNAEVLAPMKPKQIMEKLVEQAKALYEQTETEIGVDNMRVLERMVMLRAIDTLWIEHLTMMENMRHGIGLQAVGQRDPLVAYKREGHELFQNLMSTIQHDAVHTIYHIKIERQQAPEPVPSPMAKAVRPAGSTQPRQRVGSRKVGRNEPCPCGSGKKYKHCCGK